MGSLKNWLDIPQQEREAVAFVVGDADIAVDVFRRRKQAGVAGLTVEADDQKYLRTTAARIDDYSYKSRSSGAGATALVIKPTALTNDTDVREDDLWRLIDDASRVRWFRVVSVSRIRTASSVALEEVVR